MRLFVALDLDEEILLRIQKYISSVAGFAPDLRWVRPESLHITLKFIGERPQGEIDRIEEALGSVQAPSFPVVVGRYGFFPNAKFPRAFWTGVEAEAALTILVSAIEHTLAPLGISRENHPFSPHITLARGRRMSVKSQGPPPFQVLQRKLDAVAHSRIWYYDRPRVLFIRKSSCRGRILLQEDCALCIVID